MNTLTVKQALEQGYTYCVLEDGETGLIKIEESIYFSEGDYFLTEKTPHPFQISDKDIEEMVIDLLCNQDEVNDEDGDLADLVSDAKIDFSEVTQKVNDALSAKKYYQSTQIKLIP